MNTPAAASRAPIRRRRMAWLADRLQERVLLLTGQLRLPLVGQLLHPPVVDLGVGPDALAALPELRAGRVVVDLAGCAAGDHAAGETGVGRVPVAVGVTGADRGDVGELHRHVAEVPAAPLAPEVG